MLVMTIGELARRAGVGVETVRFYQRSGLLGEPAKRPGSRRLYTDEHLNVLRFIRRCKGLGFSMKDIAPLLALRRSPSRRCSRLHEMVEQAMHVLDAKKRMIEMRRAALSRMLEACVNEGNLSDCILLAALEE
jgi:MerR family mercuric resistance operon transcriptional regulator